MMSASNEKPVPIAVLKRFLVTEPKPRPGEMCEMCRQPIAAEHSHVVNVQSRSLMCTCRACYLLFTPNGAAQGKYRAVPDRYRRLDSFELDPMQWERLQIPVGIAFFFFNSATRKISSFYPSPAGATESLLSLDAWDEIVAANPSLVDLAPDVEAMLVYRRRRTDRFDSFIVPIDACYELTGKVRRYWKGFDGGEEVWREIDSFFSSLQAKSRPDSVGAAS
jgi:hypothetical protein